MYSRLAFAILFLYLGFMIGTQDNIRYPFSVDSDNYISPSDKITSDDLTVFKDKAVIEKENIIWAKIKGTHSMEPVLNSDSISLEQKPSSINDISIGDIITYSKDKITIIHRVMEIGIDDNGWFAITKGDNNPEEDPLKVRFNQVKGVVIGILY